MLDEAAKDAQAGLTAPAPEGADSANFDKMKTAVTPLFDGAIANDDLGKKDYDNAIKYFQDELKAMPAAQQTAGPGIEDTYLLGTAYVQKNPQDLVNAVWYLSRAAAYAPEPFKDEIQKAAQYWYKKYHGGYGWIRSGSGAGESISESAGRIYHYSRAATAVSSGTGTQCGYIDA